MREGDMEGRTMDKNHAYATRPEESPTEWTDTPTLTLYVRSLAPSDHRKQQQKIVQRLNQLETDGLVDSYTVEVWGDQLPVSAAEQTAVGRELRHLVDTFHTWAADHDVSIESFFPREPVRSELTGETYTRIGLPTMALAEYVDDELQCFSPYSDGETVRTVSMHIESLEARKHRPAAVEGQP